MQTRLYRPENVTQGLVAGEYDYRFLALDDDLILVIAHEGGFLPVRPEHAPDLFDLFSNSDPFAGSELATFDSGLPPASPAPAALPLPARPAPSTSGPTDALMVQIQQAISDSDTPRLQSLYAELAALRPAPQEITDESLVMLPPEALEAEKAAEREVNPRA